MKNVGRLAYLFPAFPVFHQTFVLWEVLGMKRNGADPLIYSLRRGTEKQQDEARPIIDEVVYLPSLLSRAVLLANLRFAVRAPWRYVALYAAVARAWATGTGPRSRHAEWEKGSPSLQDRLRGWYNRQPHLYLLKSWLLVPQAVELAGRLARAGVTHLHVHWATYPATVALVVKRALGIPFSISAHAYDIYMIQRMLPAKVAEARWVFTCAETNAAYLRSLSAAKDRAKIIVSYHGVDVERFAPPAQRPQNARLRVLSCGQLERYKGMHLLIEACGKLHAQGLPIECRIVGEGPYRSILEEQIERLGLADVVHLAGARPHAELARMLAESDVFALASELGGKSGRRDVIANVIVEAMATGLPVITTRIPGAEELVEDGVSGLLVRPNRADEVATALRRLALAPEERQRIGAAARAKVVRDFDNSKNVREMAAALIEATASSPTAPGASAGIEGGR